MATEKTFYSVLFGKEIDYQQAVALAQQHFAKNDVPFQEDPFSADLATFHRRLFSDAFAIEAFFTRLLGLQDGDVLVELTITDQRISYEITGALYELTPLQSDLGRLFFAALVQNDEFISFEQDDGGAITFSLFSDSFDIFTKK